MKEVPLINGKVAPKSVVKTLMINLENLLEGKVEGAQDPIGGIAVYELYQKAKNPYHKPFGNTQEILQKMNFIDGNGNMNDTDKYIVLSAVSIEGNGSINLIDPIAKPSRIKKPSNEVSTETIQSEGKVATKQKELI